jgi:hypothetical protein
MTGPLAPSRSVFELLNRDFPLQLQEALLADALHVHQRSILLGPSSTANPITVTIRGKAVDMCCDDCATKLKEAHAYKSRDGGTESCSSRLG